MIEEFNNEEVKENLQGQSSPKDFEFDSFVEA
jgi:hypothetical protein